MSSDNYNEYIDKGIHLFRKGVKEAKKLGKKANKEIKKVVVNTLIVVLMIVDVGSRITYWAMYRNESSLLYSSS